MLSLLLVATAMALTDDPADCSPFAFDVYPRDASTDVPVDTPVAVFTPQG